LWTNQAFDDKGTFGDGVLYPIYTIKNECLELKNVYIFWFNELIFGDLIFCVLSKLLSLYITQFSIH
jgi:hypothetical protein